MPSIIVPDRRFTPRIRRVSGFNRTSSQVTFAAASSQDSNIYTMMVFAQVLFTSGNVDLSIYGRWNGSFVRPDFRLSYNSNTVTVRHQIGSTSDGNRPVGTWSLPQIVGTGKLYWLHSAVTAAGSVSSSTLKAYAGLNGASMVDLGVPPTQNGSGTLNTGAGHPIHIGHTNSGVIYSGGIVYIARWHRVLPYHELLRVQQLGPFAEPAGLVFCYANRRDIGPHTLPISSETDVLDYPFPPSLFRPVRGRLFTYPESLQYARPISDISNSGWVEYP